MTDPRARIAALQAKIDRDALYEQRMQELQARTDLPAYLTEMQVAELFDVHRLTVYNWRLPRQGTDTIVPLYSRADVLEHARTYKHGPGKKLDLPQEKVGPNTARLKASSEANPNSPGAKRRERILVLLISGERTTASLAEALGTSQATIINDMNKLMKDGRVYRSEATYYRRS